MNPTQRRGQENFEDDAEKSQNGSCAQAKTVIRADWSKRIEGSGEENGFSSIKAYLVLLSLILLRFTDNFFTK